MIPFAVKSLARDVEEVHLLVCLAGGLKAELLPFNSPTTAAQIPPNAAGDRRAQTATHPEAGQRGPITPETLAKSLGIQAF
jgi:hypothetical protein